MDIKSLPNYEQIKIDFLNGLSLRKLEKKYKISRKKLSTIFNKEGYYTKKEYPKEIWDQAVKLYKTNSYSLTKIAKILNIDRHLLSSYLIQINLKQNNCKKIKQDIQSNEIVNLYIEGKSIGAISKIYNRSTNYIVKILNNYNVIDHNRIYRKYSINESAFENIDTEEKAYWLGFLYADGCIGNSNDIGRHTIELGLKSVDRNHLVNFLKFISPKDYLKIPLQFRIHKNGKKLYYSYRTWINNKKLANDLKQAGCFTAKSLILKFPNENQVPLYLLRHFIRGYFDGDGYNSIYSNTLCFGICGTRDFCCSFEEHLFNLKIINSIQIYQDERSKIFQTSHGGNIQAKKFFDYIYKNASIYLDRKYYNFHYILHKQMPS